MYNVSKQKHIKYGNVIEITRIENGTYKTPGLAYNYALIMKRKWRDEGAPKVRFLIDGQVLNATQVERWSNEEYKSLPKCWVCGQILNGEVHTHRLGGNRLFCSQICSDKDYLEEVDRLHDEEEIDYL